MSSPSTHIDPRSDSADASLDERIRAVLARSYVLDPLQQVSFWCAIALPFLYAPLLATGIESTAELWALLGLVLVNVLAAAVGHGYSPE